MQHAMASSPRNGQRGAPRDVVKLTASMMRWFRFLGFVSKLLPTLAGRVAVRLFTRPRRFRRPDAEIRVMWRGEHFELLPGTSAWRWGEGPPVLLVHGWEGRGTQLGAFVRPLVHAGYQVIAFDARAHGSSFGTNANLADFADAIAAVERREGPLHSIVAHSFGCAAATLAVQRGVRTDALVYVAPPANLDVATNFFGRLVGLSEAALTNMKSRLTKQVRVDFDQLRVENFGPRMRTPLYVVHDQDDRDVSVDSAQLFARHWPESHLTITQGLGHRRVLKDQAVVLQILEFIQSIQPSDSRVALRQWMSRQALPEPAHFGT